MRDLLARDRAHLIHPQHDRAACDAAHVWVKGEGALLTDDSGAQYLDGLAGLWNVIAGHGRVELADAAREQMIALGFASGYAGGSNRSAIELAERLAALTYPSINHFFFTSGGAEANETAIKIARSFWKIRGKPGKTKVISRELGYHGVTLAAMSATGLSAYWPRFEPRVPGFVHVPPLAASELEQAILREGADTVAMFLAEPVQGVGGVVVPPADYFPLVREICARHDVLLAADEVITGFGRTGRMFALEHWDVQPDLLQFAKGITSGYFPFGGVGISDEIAAALESEATPWMHAFTYSAHPVGCAVALKTLEILDREDLVARAAAQGTHLLMRLRATLGDHPHVGEIRGLGLMCAVEFVQNRQTKAELPAAEKVGARINAEAQRRGLFSRNRADIYMLAPPFVITTEQIDRIVDILDESVRSVLGN